jgi:YfiH family protein
MATADDPERVRANRERVARALDIPAEWVSLKQVHGAEVVEVTGVQSGGGRHGDALCTSAPGVPIAVMAADCLPVALVSERTSAVAHAGWRGLCAGVLEAAVGRFAGDNPTAWIGPSIGPCHYQVGSEVVEAFTRSYPGSPEFWVTDGSRFRFDLRAAGRWVLRRAGARVEEDEPPCTLCDQRFFSFRRDGETGRHAVVVWR